MKKKKTVHRWSSRKAVHGPGGTGRSHGRCGRQKKSHHIFLVFVFVVVLLCIVGASAPTSGTGLPWRSPPPNPKKTHDSKQETATPNCIQPIEKKKTSANIKKNAKIIIDVCFCLPQSWGSAFQLTRNS